MQVVRWRCVARIATTWAALAGAGCGGPAGSVPDGGGADAASGDAADAAAPDAIQRATIAGTVAELHDRPLEGATVVIGSATATTDALGRFEIADVQLPYDVIIVPPAMGWLVQYRGLTKLEPWLNTFINQTNDKMATLTGTFVDDGDFVSPNPASTSTSIKLLGSTMSPVGDSGGQYFGPGAAVETFSFTVRWSGPASFSGTVRALQTAYRAYGEMPVSGITDGAVIDVGPLAMGSVLERTAFGEVIPPAGYSFRSYSGSVHFPDATYLALASSNVNLSTTFSLLYPQIEGTTQSLRIGVENATDDAYIDHVKLVVPDGAAMTIEVPTVTPPAPISPAHGATDVDASTAFAWQHAPDAVYALIVSNGSSWGQGMVVVTTGSSAVRPDGSPHGIALNPGVHTWLVQGFHGLASVDALASPAEVSDRRAGRVEATNSSSAVRVFQAL